MEGIDFHRVNSQSADEILSEANELYGRWPTMSKEKKRVIVESITDKIVVGSGNESSITIELAYLPSSEELTTKQRNFRIGDIRGQSMKRNCNPFDEQIHKGTKCALTLIWMTETCLPVWFSCRSNHAHQ